MITDILVALGLGAVIVLLVYFAINSARTAQKGNAPVVESSLSKKEREQRKQEQEEKSVVAPTSNNNNNQKKATASSSPVAAAAEDKKKVVAAPTKATPSSPTASSPKSSSPTKSNASSSVTSSPTTATAPKKSGKKSKKELDAAEEAEMDAFVALELKRTGNQGIRKEKFQVVNLDDIQQEKERKAARLEKKSEGATFTEKQVAVEKAAGFRVVGAQEAAKKEAKKEAKATSPAGRDDEDNGNGKKRREPMTREEELDAALRSVLSSRRGDKKGGRGGGFGGGFGGEGRRERGEGEGNNTNKDSANKDAKDKGVVDIKGEVKASRPGGAWGRTE